jgi:NAD(P)-dependent dehydrogenase (short-subunit alcohol dehydrogenase family)
MTAANAAARDERRQSAIRWFRGEPGDEATMSAAGEAVRAAAVTGASSGIGEATARALAAAGHPVVLGARRVERCEEIAAEIRADGGQAAAEPLDVADLTSVAAFVKSAEAAFGPLGVVVSNAGDLQPTTIAETDPGDFAAQISVNLVGAQRLVSLVVPGMIDRGRGDVVVVTSDVVRAPRPRMGAYVAAKAGLEGMVRALQLELEGTGVRASMVRPGPTWTGMGMTWPPEVYTPVLREWKRHGIFRHDGYLTPEGVASAVLAVVSAPPGTHLTLVEVEPEAPLRPPAAGAEKVEVEAEAPVRSSVEAEPEAPVRPPPAEGTESDDEAETEEADR